MSAFRHPTRRRFAALLASLLSSAMTRAHAAGDKPRDNGIGGTGYLSAIPDRDNGIGGTGIVGTIRAFGSIIVNGLRVSYPADAEVRIDGRRARVGDLRIGHVVSLVAMRDGDKFTTTKIQILREVVGPIEQVFDHGLRVLGQRVEFARGAKIEAGAFSVGRRVAVSGLRLPNQTIVASLVESAEPGAAQLVGVVTRSFDGRLAIGAQPLSGIAEAMLGQRVLVRGAETHGALDVTSTAADVWLPRGPSDFLVETYLERHGATVKTASGATLDGGRALPFQGVARAVVRIDATLAGAWSIRSLRTSETLGKRGAAEEPRAGSPFPNAPSRPAEPQTAPGVEFPSGFGGPDAPRGYGTPAIPSDPVGPSFPGGFGGGGRPGPGGLGRPGR
ncbi:DUF5666 domain-containing protein [Methylosinus sporium]|uniref:DUF5666 domain-containing protein n=1 Tax=Methylosinus sporium TaxID=428 RepID=A0A2U1SRF8_METSR|nr:DUF5666 domain-containing protein [Methylosinus sporium]PWB94204.1 hypothetical protein C5689_08805 [Methylosinus sporium]